MFCRTISNLIRTKIGKGKAIVVMGPRQVGKTTLINQLLSGQKHLFLNADDPVTRQSLTNPSTEQLRSIVGANTLVFLDEAQRIPNIGLTLKIIADQFKDVQLLVSASSSFELGNEINEPLTGRKWEYQLYPISWEEMENQIGYLTAEQQLENRLLYGFYPDVLNNPGEEVEVLRQLVNSYLYKDILAFGNIRKPELLEKLVQALALQIGSEVSYNELAQLLGVDKNTVSNYIDLLQKGFIVFKLGSFSRNLRNEIKTNQKIYFYDVGVRNTVIGNFSNLELRQDKGILWENFLIAERLKQNAYHGSLAKIYFWRTTRQQEVDFIEEESGKISAFEFKWKAKGKTRFPRTFLSTYDAEAKEIDRSNFRDFVMRQTGRGR